jgi:hypothetical protein
MRSAISLPGFMFPLTRCELINVWVRLNAIGDVPCFG